MLSWRHTPTVFSTAQLVHSKVRRNRLMHYLQILKSHLKSSRQSPELTWPHSCTQSRHSSTQQRFFLPRIMLKSETKRVVSWQRTKSPLAITRGQQTKLEWYNQRLYICTFSGEPFKWLELSVRPFYLKQMWKTTKQPKALQTATSKSSWDHFHAFPL